MGPNTKTATPATTANSGTPSPNKQVHENPFFRVGLPGRARVKDRREPLLLTDLRKLELVWVRNKGDPETDMGGFGIEERERVVDSDEIPILDLGGRVKVGFFWGFD